MSEILTPEQVQECSDYYFVSPLARSHEALRAERDRLAAEVDRLLQALRNIRLAAARGRTFGHQATLQPHVRMAARKDEALEHVLQFCAQLGVEGSLLRKANAARAEAPTPAREEP